MSKPCNRPGCQKRISEMLFACKPDWFALPNAIRTRINASKPYSEEAVDAGLEALEFWRDLRPTK